MLIFMTLMILELRINTMYKVKKSRKSHYFKISQRKFNFMMKNLTNFQDFNFFPQKNDNQNFQSQYPNKFK